jgi:hypothetical protein
MLLGDIDKLNFLQSFASAPKDEVRGRRDRILPFFEETPISRRTWTVIVRSLRVEAENS